MFLKVCYVNTNQITWNDIVKVVYLLNTTDLLGIGYKIMYEELCKCENFITLEKFFTFVNNSHELWEPIFAFQKYIIVNYLSPKIVLQILDRKIKIQYIREYRSNHFGKFPPETCRQRIDNIIFKIPNPYVFDYDNVTINDSEMDEEICFNKVEEIFYKLYNVSHKKKSMKFSIKYLTSFTNDPLLISIGKYYQFLKFRNRIKSTENTVISILGRDESCASSLNEAFNMTSNSRPSSILRSSNKCKVDKRRVTVTVSENTDISQTIIVSESKNSYKQTKPSNSNFTIYGE